MKLIKEATMPFFSGGSRFYQRERTTVSAGCKGCGGWSRVKSRAPGGSFLSMFIQKGLNVKDLNDSLPLYLIQAWSDQAPPPHWLVMAAKNSLHQIQGQTVI